MKCAFVAGATGYTGQEVVKELLRENITTVAHIRPDSPRLDYWANYFEALGAQIDFAPWESKEIEATLEAHQPNLVFAMLGTTKKRARRAKTPSGDATSESYDAVDFGYTAMLIDAGQKLLTKPRFVYLSALGVSQHSPGSYMKARWKAEEYLKRSGLPHTIVQPCIISGVDRQESRPLERIAANLGDTALSALSLVGGSKLKRKYESISGPNLAEAMVRLALEPSAENTVVPAELLR